MRLFSGLLSALLLIGVVWLWRKNQKLKFDEGKGRLQEISEFLSAKPLEAKELAKKWKKVIDRLENQDEASLKLALIEADNLLDEALQRKGYSGENFAERLQRLNTEKLPNLEAVWEAHKKRNSIVHNRGQHLSFSEARRMIDIYEEALRNLKAI